MRKHIIDAFYKKKDKFKNGFYFEFPYKDYRGREEFEELIKRNNLVCKEVTYYTAFLWEEKTIIQRLFNKPGKWFHNGPEYFLKSDYDNHNRVKVSYYSVAKTVKDLQERERER